MRALLLRSPCFLFLPLATSSAWSLDPDRHISQYGHTAWRIQDGFFGGPARSIYPDHRWVYLDRNRNRTFQI